MDFNGFNASVDICGPERSFSFFSLVKISIKNHKNSMFFLNVWCSAVVFRVNIFQ